MWVEDVACFLKLGARKAEGRLSGERVLNPPPLRSLQGWGIPQRHVDSSMYKEVPLTSDPGSNVG